MSVLRLARAYTKRNKIIKFAGCYHGHHDSLLVKARALLPLVCLIVQGVPPSVADGTITVEYNDAEQLAAVFSRMGVKK